MKRLILTLSLAAAALSGCAQLKEWSDATSAEGGASGVEQPSPFPRPRYNPNFNPA